MAYPSNKPSGSYSLRNYDFAENDSKKLPMDEYLFKNGYKNKDESTQESVPDAHEQNWLFDVLHRNLKYTLETAEENKSLLANKVATPTSIGQVKIGYGLEITSNGVLSVQKDIAADANIISYDLPVGSYMLWAGNNTPEYFIEPQGQTLLRSSYPELWQFAQNNSLVATSNTFVSGKLFGPGDGSTTFVVFDIRGQFIRIANGSRAVGTYQDDALQTHTHTYRSDDPNSRPRGDDRKHCYSTDVYYETSGPNGCRVADETRPKNYALKLILKALPTPPSNAVPTGTILDYTGPTAPDGYIIANGAELSRTTFAKLFQWVVANNLLVNQSSIPLTAHGYYGTGNGSTTFTIPDLRGVFKRSADLASNRGGVSRGVYQADGLPDHNHTLTLPGNAGSVFPSKYIPAWSNDDVYMSDRSSTATVTNASNSNAIYGKANQVQPKSVAIIPILKY